MMKKLFLTLGLVASLASLSLAEEKVVEKGVYNGGEFGVSLGTAYNVKPSAPFQDPYSLNLVAGVHYFPVKYIGVEANVPFYQTKGVSVDEVQAGLLFRAPIGHLAPYLGLGPVYNWHSDQSWAYLGKLGLEFRLNSKWSIFTEGQYRENDLKFDNGEISVKGGIKLNF